MLFRSESISRISCTYCVFGCHQAYTMELEAEVAKLKNENEELRKKQVSFVPLLFVVVPASDSMLQPPLTKF